MLQLNQFVVFYHDSLSVSQRIEQYGIGVPKPGQYKHRGHEGATATLWNGVPVQADSIVHIVSIIEDPSDN